MSEGNQVVPPAPAESVDLAALANPALFAPAVVVLVELVSTLLGRPIALPQEKAAIIAEAAVPVLVKWTPKASTRYAEEMNLLLVAGLVIGGEWRKGQ